MRGRRASLRAPLANGSARCPESLLDSPAHGWLRRSRTDPPEEEETQGPRLPEALSHATILGLAGFESSRNLTFGTGCNPHMYRACPGVVASKDPITKRRLHEGWPQIPPEQSAAPPRPPPAAAARPPRSGARRAAPPPGAGARRGCRGAARTAAPLARARAPTARAVDGRGRAARLRVELDFAPCPSSSWVLALRFCGKGPGSQNPPIPNPES